MCRRKREKAERHGVWERESQAGEVSILCVSVMYQKSALLFMFSAPVTESEGGGVACCHVSSFSSNRFSSACSNQLLLIHTLPLYVYTSICIPATYYSCKYITVWYSIPYTKLPHYYCASGLKFVVLNSQE